MKILAFGAYVKPLLLPKVSRLRLLNYQTLCVEADFLVASTNAYYAPQTYELKTAVTTNFDSPF